MAPVKRRLKKALAPAPPPLPVIDPADRLSKLPQEILAQILSFLPSQEVVRTCVLARTWRDVWKFTRRLHITGDSVHEVRKFMDCLLRVRLDGIQLASLDATEIWIKTFEEMDDYGEPILNAEDMSCLNRWIRSVLKCQIQMLRVNIDARGYFNAYLQLQDMPLVSQHLTWLELTGIWFMCRCLNLDGCPALEHLEIKDSHVAGVRRIMSLSLKHLLIKSCDSNEDRKRIWICVPRLISLLLDDMFSLRTPLLERMPELVGAKVQINSYLDNCHCEDPMACSHVMEASGISDSDFDSDDEEGSFDYAGQNTTECMVLEGLAQAKDLVLIANCSTFIFRRDLRWCPIFSKLKTLVVNHDYWCQPADCSALACILEHAPVLEKLALVPDQVLPATGKYKVEMKGHPDATAKSNKIPQHLKIVEISCEDVNERFLNVLNFFGAMSICFDIKVTKQ